MYVGRDFDVANPTESEVYSLDFRNGLQSGESIAVASTTMTVFQAVDPNPSSHLSGSPAISLSGTVVSQRIVYGLR
jgi:beta-glucosidase-like glycosyl hydrolase